MTSVIERARRYISKCAPAISGQGGHDATFHVAAVLVHGFALAESDALRLLHEYNARCLPEWNERELLHKIASAASAQHAEARGHLLGNGECGVRNAEWGATAGKAEGRSQKAERRNAEWRMQNARLLIRWRRRNVF